jgi:transcriptional regulator with XRE-family HTH domain
MQKSSTPVMSPRVPPFRTVRIAHGLSLRETARRSNMDPGHLSKVERGQAGVSVEQLKRLADVLGLNELSKLLAPYVGTGK